MSSSATNRREYAEITTTPRPVFDGTAALEVRAHYRGVLIGERFLCAAEATHRARRPRGLARHATYTIGESARADAPAASELLGGPDLPLVTRWAGGFLVNVTPGMTGNVATGGKIYRLADYVAGRGSNFTLPADGSARIDCGAMSFQLTPTTRTEPLPRRWFTWRWDEHKFTVASFLALAVFLVMIFTVPPEGVSVSSDMIGMSRTVIPFTIKAPTPDDVPTFVQPTADKGQGEAGKPHAGPSGKQGNPNAKGTGAHAVKKNGEPPHLGKADAEAQARNAGLIGVLNQTAGTRFSSIFGYGSAAGDAEKDIVGNLVAANFGDGYGTGGWGVIGTGNGGGGTGLTSIGIGNYNTLGGRGYGHDPGIGGLAPKKHVKIGGIYSGVVSTKGSLDKEIIRRIVRLHMNEVKYCYDQELVRSKGLEGRISLQFMISGTGQVISSFVQSTTMNNVRVESCVANAVKRWSFPKPNNAGIAIVSYPFNFVAGAEN